MEWKIGLDGCPLFRFAVDIDESVVLLDDTVDGGQAQPGPLAEPLGCKEGLEHFVQGFGRHAAAIVADGQHDVVAGDETRAVGAVVLVEADILGFNSHLAHIFYGVPRIDAQIGQDLIDLGG